MTLVEDRPLYSYALATFSSVRGVFAGWNDALSSNATASKSEISAILAILNPDRHTSFAGDDLYQALILRLPFFFAYNGTGVPLGMSLENIGGLLLELVEFSVVPLSNISAPANIAGVAKGSALASTLPQLARIGDSVVQEGFGSIVKNLDTFSKMTTDGPFAPPRPWFIPQDPASFAQPFLTGVGGIAKNRIRVSHLFKPATQIMTLPT